MEVQRSRLESGSLVASRQKAWISGLEECLDNSLTIALPARPVEPMTRTDGEDSEEELVFIVFATQLSCETKF